MRVEALSAAATRTPIPSGRARGVEQRSAGTVGRGLEAIPAAEAGYFEPLVPLSAPLYSKLMVGDASDPAERAADAFAERVMGGGGGAAAGAVGAAGGGVLRRKCSACEEEDGKLHRKEAAGGGGGGSWSAPPVVHQALASPGHALDAGARGAIEGRGGVDLSEVRVHTDGLAAESAKAVGARAYTVGRDLVFGAGEYRPGTSEGLRLIAHEVGHLGTGVVRRESLDDKAVWLSHDELDRPEHWTKESWNSIRERIRAPEVDPKVAEGKRGTEKLQEWANHRPEFLDEGFAPSAKKRGESGGINWAVRHKIPSDLLKKRALALVNGKSVEAAASALADHGIHVPPPPTHQNVLKGAKAYFRMRYFHPDNLWLGPAKSNSGRGERFDEDPHASPAQRKRTLQQFLDDKDYVYRAELAKKHSGNKLVADLEYKATIRQRRLSWGHEIKDSIKGHFWGVRAPGFRQTPYVPRQQISVMPDRPALPVILLPHTPKSPHGTGASKPVHPTTRSSPGLIMTPQDNGSSLSAPHSKAVEAHIPAPVEVATTPVVASAEHNVPPAPARPMPTQEGDGHISPPAHEDGGVAHEGHGRDPHGKSSKTLAKVGGLLTILQGAKDYNTYRGEGKSRTDALKEAALPAAVGLSDSIGKFFGMKASNAGRLAGVAQAGLNFYQLTKEGMRPSEAAASAIGSTVGQQAIGTDPFSMTAGLVNQGLVLVGAPTEVQQQSKAMVDVSPGGVASALLSHGLRGVVNTYDAVRTGNFSGLERQQAEMLSGKGGDVLRGYALTTEFFTQLAITGDAESALLRLPKGEDSYLTKAADRGGNLAYQLINGTDRKAKAKAYIEFVDSAQPHWAAVDGLVKKHGPVVARNVRTQGRAIAQHVKSRTAGALEDAKATVTNKVVTFQRKVEQVHAQVQAVKESFQNKAADVKTEVVNQLGSALEQASAVKQEITEAVAARVESVKESVAHSAKEKWGRAVSFLGL